MSKLPFAGIPITVGGRDFIVPPLCLRDVKRFLPQMTDLFSKTPLEQMTMTSDVILAALQRNYPELTMDELDVLLDPMSIQATMEAIMEASGLKKKAAAPEPVPAEAETAPSIGTDSMPPSSSRPDGPGNISTSS
ncbi:MAG: hypothetical protein KGR26_14955 [Cyanobacteria bacterium REEB65]|nr:hypothetical protein [Cyanobacteria bacterium REEB65]